jgi:site-specific recombinase XerD
MSERNFVQGFVARLDDVFTTEQLQFISRKLECYISDFDIHHRETSLMVYDGMPEAYKIFMVSKKVKGCSDGTLKQYKIVLDNLFHTIHKPLNEITTNDMRLYLYHLKETRNLQDSTLEDKRNKMCGFFKWCVKSKYLKDNPMDLIDPIRFEKKLPETFSDTQMAQLRESCKSIRDKAILEVFYSSGMRCGELKILKKSDIDPLTREVKVFGKGRKGRKIYVSPTALVLLDMYYKERKDDSEYMFVSSRKPHNPMTNGGIEKIIKRIGKRALDGVRSYPHRIRRTFASDAIERGMDVFEVQYLMGHVKTETTMRYVKLAQAKVGADYNRCFA